MFKALGNIRGFTQGILRGAVAAGRKVAETFSTLVETGLDYAVEQFESDFFAYDQQKTTCDLIRGLDPDHLIHGVLHIESPQNLSAKFKYDLESTYEDVKGNTETHYWSILSNTRLTQAEISERADTFAEDYAPAGFPMHSPVELVASWVKQ